MNYYTDSEHRFMAAVSETLVDCGFDEYEAHDLGHEALAFGEDIPMSDAEMKYGQVSFEVCGHKVTIYYKECRQYYAGQEHLRTHCRRTYVSSRWYQCEVDNLSTRKSKWFKTKIKEDNWDGRLEAFTKAVDKALLEVIS